MSKVAVRFRRPHVSTPSLFSFRSKEYFVMRTRGNGNVLTVVEHSGGIFVRLAGRPQAETWTEATAEGETSFSVFPSVSRISVGTC
jgi:hypothetical protein